MASDEQAAILLHHLALPLVHLVHDDEIAEADAVLARYDADQLRRLALLLAALVDRDVSWREALAWWLDPPATVVPLHRDEAFEPVDVRPLVAERFGLPERKKAA